MIEKMERVLEDKLRDRKEPLLNRLQGKPTTGESTPQLLSHPCGPGLPGAWASGAELWQRMLPHIEAGSEGLPKVPWAPFSCQEAPQDTWGQCVSWARKTGAPAQTHREAPQTGGSRQSREEGLPEPFSGLPRLPTSSESASTKQTALFCFLHCP